MDSPARLWDNHRSFRSTSASSSPHCSPPLVPGSLRCGQFRPSRQCPRLRSAETRSARDARYLRADVRSGTRFLRPRWRATGRLSAWLERLRGAASLATDAAPASAPAPRLRPQLRSDSHVRSLFAPASRPLLTRPSPRDVPARIRSATLFRSRRSVPAICALTLFSTLRIAPQPEAHLFGPFFLSRWRFVASRRVRVPLGCAIVEHYTRVGERANAFSPFSANLATSAAVRWRRRRKATRQQRGSARDSYSDEISYSTDTDAVIVDVPRLTGVEASAEARSALYAACGKEGGGEESGMSAPERSQEHRRVRRGRRRKQERRRGERSLRPPVGARPSRRAQPVARSDIGPGRCR